MPEEDDGDEGVVVGPVEAAVPAEAWVPIAGSEVAPRSELASTAVPPTSAIVFISVSSSFFIVDIGIGIGNATTPILGVTPAPDSASCH